MSHLKTFKPGGYQRAITPLRGKVLGTHSPLIYKRKQEPNNPNNSSGSEIKGRKNK